MLNEVKHLKVSVTVDGRTAREILEFLYPAPPWHNKRACSAHSLIAAFTTVQDDARGHEPATIYTRTPPLRLRVTFL